MSAKMHKKIELIGGRYERERYQSKLNLPSKLLGLRNRCTSAAAIFTQAKWVGDALKQNAG